ncbi:CGNR zinc finger domain-containing protein [Actinomadura barringtoniae]|uniref:CGNR zinc finger domain-containing protein n=1 Tax=Actinomadura barringtoniae TaxID=1427535 RepID=A0A939P773_9ACTN|nr:CGNR zinc finger domain-containing protein [Actinomadura barringtoniae]MBO2446670.1 CGNR zinc finger domain-containing protein [Actinomadura barringtoniae]
MADEAGTPSPALLLRDFVNTRDVECDADEFATPAKLAGWLAARGLIPRRVHADPHDLAMAVTLREGLRTAMLTHHGPSGDELPPELDAALATLPLRVRMNGTIPSLEPLEGGTAAAGLARLAAAVMEAAADGSWPRLKVCQENTCRWAFLDTSKNRSRNWCSMRVCGNRTKTRTYRARRRTVGS